MDFRKIRTRKAVELIMPYEKLKSVYDDINSDRSDSYKKTVTTFENQFYTKLRKTTKLKVYRSLWIGSYCCDFYIPSLKSFIQTKKTPSMGVVIEIDGSIHNREFKMRNDEKKINEFFNYNIIVTAIDNSDVNKTHINELLIKQLSTLPRHDSRAIKRNMRNIFLITIFKCLEKDEIFEKFPLLNMNTYHQILNLIEGR